ncbi:MAG: acyltransferase family protein [Chlorobiaceae bacterium]|nr:acyltransferase family protein [Chlorobiaceae bacterium]
MRDIVIDIGKGIGIFFVIWGHTICIINDYIYSFHIPFFFIVSGYFYSYMERYGDFFVKNVKRLLYPYAGYSLFAFIFYALWFAVFLRGERFEYNSILKVFAVHDTVIAPLWFLVSLFEVTLLYDMIRRVVRGNVWVVLICFLFTVTGYIASPANYGGYVNYFHIISSLSMMFFYCAGAQLRLNGLSLYLKDKKMGVLFMVLALIVFMITSGYSSGIDINSNSINAPFIVYLANAFLGSFLMMDIAALIGNVPVIKKILAFIGDRSLAVFALHFPMFEISRPLVSMVFEKNTYVWGFALSVTCLLVSLLCAYFIDIAICKLKKVAYSL